MYCVFECGCLGTTDWVCARCPTHNKLSNSLITTAPSTNPKRWTGTKSTIVLNSLRDSFARMSPESVDLIVTYPNQTEFYARIQSDFLNMPDLFFSEYHKVLKEGGLAILFVEQSVLSAATYAACLHNFNVNSISIVGMKSTVPISCYHTTGYKFCLVLSKGDNDLTLGNFTVRDFSRLFDRLPGKTVLDPTCHYPEIIFGARKAKRKVIGFCYDFHVFKHVVQTLRKAE